jgi:membrane protein implicated in regulation of membrane protease activity
MGNAIETGIFLVWFTAQAAFVGLAYLMAIGKGRHPLAWTLAAAFCGPLAVLVLLFLKEDAPEGAIATNARSLRAVPVRSRRSFMA